MDEVWQVETGEYEQRHTMFVADSPELAEKRIHETYPPPFEVAWEPMKDTSWDGGGTHYQEFTVVGHFARVQGCSIKHTADFTIGTLEYVKDA